MRKVKQEARPGLNGRSHYANYLKEREGKEVYESEEGFISYVIEGDECYIETIYVAPIFRRLSSGTNMANIVATRAKEAGCKFLSGSSDPRAHGATDAMMAMLTYGFKLHSIKGDLIVLTKKL